MKNLKFLSLFCVTVMLMASLCVPAFAADEAGEWVTISEDITDGSWESTGIIFFIDGNPFSFVEGDCVRFTIDNEVYFITLSDNGDGVLSGIDEESGYHCPGLFVTAEKTAFLCDCCLLEFSTPVKVEKFVASDGFSIFSDVTTVVSSSISWLSAFALCIVSNPLLLIFVCCAFVGLGICLLKRIRHL